MDELRRSRRRRLDVEITDTTDLPSVADDISAIADRDQLERGFSRLEPEERAVIVLHHYLDLPLPEVAATLRIPLGTAKSRLYRGLREMRAALDADARPGRDLREGHPA
jgi:RNA polymerase sigma-70 factor (ECF subfamily)